MPNALDHRTVVSLKRSVHVFAALGDPTRLALVTMLTDGTPRSITHLARGKSVTRQSITKHLRVLADAGLVRSFKRGRETCYQLHPDPLDQARRSLETISRQWDAALQRLKSALENE